MGDGSLAMGCRRPPTATLTCAVCAEVKAPSAFYERSDYPGRRHTKCIECFKAQMRQRRRDRGDHVRALEAAAVARDPGKKRAASRRYFATETGKQKRREGVAKWASSNPEKRAAHVALNHAVKRGTIVRGACERCGATAHVHGHHDDYSQHLSVRWLCPIHHAERHKELHAQLQRGD